METRAVFLNGPEDLHLDTLALKAPGAGDIVVEIAHSGISTGTEKLFWNGTMPPFPGMGYPLVPGYEAAGEVVEAAPDTGFKPGDHVFVPGADCFDGAFGLFGGAASRLVTSAARVTRIDSQMGPEGALLAPAPTVWETEPGRFSGARGYEVIDPADDPRRDYRTIYDASGNAAILNDLIGRIQKGGEIVLAGFYPEALSFAFPPAFMKEARLRVAAEWAREDLAAVSSLIDQGALSLGGLITHQSPAAEAPSAYRTAFGDPDCLKMILNWKDAA